MSSTYFENTSTLTYASTHALTSTCMSQEWEGAMLPFPANDPTTYSTMNYNTNITRIICSYTIAHLNVTSSEIVESFMLILNDM